MRTLSLDDYEITREGQVINRHTGRILKPQPNGKGYLRVSIGQRLRFVHRLVAEQHVPNPNNYEQVNHKDGNKLNNHADNLEWVSNQQNRDHAVETKLHLQGEACSWSKLDWEKVDFIRNHLEISAPELASLFGVTASTIRDVRNYRSWKKK